MHDRADSTPTSRTAEEIASAIREGFLPSDHEFDRFLAEDVREVSGVYWTQLRVAARVAEWACELSIRHVVDIGSGSGKFCVGAALAGNARFTGIEQRPRLVAAARELAKTFGVGDRVQFLEGSFPAVTAEGADAYYLYNPFAENRLDVSNCIDDDVELSDVRYHEDIASIGALLRRSPIGTCLITYNGFGGKVPGGYRRVRSDDRLPNMLQVWQRAR
ncbi:MAG TPA: methyltransferase domain-containing protein [Polyangiales bacterium]|nr:methyltransferase domain-containing protein [Polyangiales bacterium]